MRERRILLQDIHRLDLGRTRTALLPAAAPCHEYAAYEHRNKCKYALLDAKQIKNLLFVPFPRTMFLLR